MKIYTLLKAVVAGDSLAYDMMGTYLSRDDAKAAAEENWNINGRTMPMHLVENTIDRLFHPGRTVESHMRQADYDKLCEGDISPLDPEITKTIKEAAENIHSPAPDFDLETDYCLYNLDNDLLVVDWR